MRAKIITPYHSGSKFRNKRIVTSDLTIPYNLEKKPSGLKEPPSPRRGKAWSVYAFVCDGRAKQIMLQKSCRESCVLREKFVNLILRNGRKT